ncbi:hypothetical protein ACWGH8_39570 [Nonomuraea muscovyensis]|uniref:Uncharacterized protein n=1 Tax=Nonomuraea muscovyensis TaxID=1124761 RepID=A0A7X0F1D2_9ACTN|nr:hypothetical protein [Nonomuraea muscovyensis]MBB6349444.1 hypothetical protein [Nonomuraea muscovyensis]
MTYRNRTSARLRLDATLDHLAVTFRDMTAHPDEANCTCHWGSEEELALLKVPGVKLEPDLLRRTWTATDWDNPAAVLRRILPQFAAALVGGRVEPLFGMEEAGRSLARGEWQQWPAEQAAAVREWLHAWWAHTLTDPEPAVPAYELLALCTEASTTLTPWLRVWEESTHPVADRHLVLAFTHWEYHLLGDELPWTVRGDTEATTCAELTAWLLGHAPARLRAGGASDELHHRIRLLGLTGPDRCYDPHWPDRVY